MQYIKVENNGYVNQVQADPRIIFDNHGQAYQVQNNQNHGFVNEIQTGPNHGYITQVQTGPNSYHGYINQAQENYGDVNQVQTGPKNHGYINHVQNGPTRGAEPGMLTHQPILKAVEAKSVPSKDLHTFRRPNPKVKMENQGCNNQVQTGPTRGAEPGRLSDHPILQAVGANPDLHTFRRPKMENQGYNNQIQTGDTGVAKPDMLKHIQILQAVEAKPVSYPRDKFEHRIEKRGM